MVEQPDRKGLKLQAKRYLARKNPSPLTVLLAACVIGIVLGLLETGVMNTGAILRDVQDAVNLYAATGDTERYLMQITAAVQNNMFPGGPLIRLLLQAMELMISAGVILFIMNVVRTGKGSYGNLLDGFSHLLRIIGYQIITTILVWLWSLLLVIPGIIALLRYSQGLYLLLDHPEWGIMDCIGESKRMMDGHKGDYFVLSLSFFGWYLLLGVLSYVLGMFLPPLLASVLTLPLTVFLEGYTGFTLFLYYEALQGRTHDPDRLPASEEEPNFPY